MSCCSQHFAAFIPTIYAIVRERKAEARRAGATETSHDEMWVDWV